MLICNFLFFKFGKSSLNRWWFFSQGQYQNGVSLKNNRDLNQGVLSLRFKFGDLSLSGTGVIVQTSAWLLHTETDTKTDAGDDNTRRPKLTLGKNYWFVFLIVWWVDHVSIVYFTSWWKNDMLFLFLTILWYIWLDMHVTLFATCHSQVSIGGIIPHRPIT